MKVFVYSKKTNKKITEVKDVISLEEEELEAGLVVKTSSGEMLYFNINEVKTTTYQN